MTKIIVERCLQKPGLITAGKTFHLISDENGLYIIYLGKWLSGYTNASNLESLILSNQDKKNAAIHEQVISDIEEKGVEKVVENKNCALVTKNDVISISLKNIEYMPSLVIKAKNFKGTLRFWDSENKENLKEIYSQLS
ncbi:hypothetical protein [Kordia sp.]|uniref:hypothetical protein n=1 Tax=Kordia sp. TaxID=1965332 RepID=UPI003B59AA6A